MVTTGNEPPATPVRSGAVLITVFVAVFVSNLDLFVVNLALPDVGRDFDGASLGSLSWILNAYAIVFAALLVVAGRLADRHGQRQGFLLGLTLFTIGSALCAAATGVAFLIVARVIQAVGAALLLPTSLALMLAATSPQKRPGMVRAWSAVGAVAAALGPVLGGLLVQASWRWVFVLNVPIGIAALALGVRVLPRLKPDSSGHGPDLLGAGLLTLATGALALGLVEGNSWGWGDGRIVTSFLATGVLVIAFLAQSRRHPAPIVEMAVLRNTRFSTATAATLLFALAFAGEILSTALYLQNVWGYSALRTGLAMAPGPLMVPPLAALSGPLAKRFGAGVVAAAGNVCFGAGMLTWVLWAGAGHHYASDMLPGFLIGGIGVGLTLPTLTAAGAIALPPQRFATGSGILTMARQLGSVLGVAAFIGVLGTPHSVDATVDAFHNGWIALAAASALAAVAALTVGRPQPSGGGAAPMDSGRASLVNQ